MRAAGSDILHMAMRAGCAWLFLWTGSAARAATIVVTAPPFNAACDGVTNDVLPVQAAINALADGDTLLIPGLAAIGAPGLSISGLNNVVIMGTAPGAGFRALTDNYPSGLTLGPTMVRIANCTGLQVLHVLLDGDERDFTPICFGACTDCRMAWCEVRGLLAPPDPAAFRAVAGITSLGCVGLVLEYNHIHDLHTQGTDGPRGIWVGAVDTSWYDAHGVIRRNLIERTAATGIACHTGFITVDSNTVRTSRGAGIKVNTTQPGDSGDVRLRWNTLVDHDFHGIQLNSFGTATTLRNVLIEGNRIDSARNSGIHVFDRVRGLMIRGNHFQRHSLNNCANGYNWGEGGIYLAAAARDVLIEDNLFDPEGGPACGQGVGIESFWYTSFPPRNIRICGNTFVDQLYNGVRIRTTPGSQPIDSVRIADNAFVGMGHAGLEVIDGAGVIGTVWSCSNGFSGGAPAHLLTGFPSGQLITGCEGCAFDLSTGTAAHLAIRAAPWPNPATDELRLPEPGPYQLFDGQGRLVRGSASPAAHVGLEGLAPGTYVLEHAGKRSRVIVVR